MTKNYPQVKMTKFKKVYFRINTPSYYKNKHGVGFENQESGDQFKEQITKLFLNDGWKIEDKKYSTSNSCNTVIKDKQSLYLHPQSLSGVILEKNILYIENLLSNSDLFKFERVDIYEDIYDLSDNDYLELLKSNQSEIEKEILEAYKTKRKNLYITDTWNPLQNILKNYKVERLKKYMGISSSDIDYKFMNELFESLAIQNKIVSAECKNGLGYRTINKAEQKELKIVI